MELTWTRDEIIIALIVLALALVGIFAAAGRLRGFVLYPEAGGKLSRSQKIGQSTQVIGSWVLLFGVFGFLTIAISSCGAHNGHVTSGAFLQMIGNDFLIALAAAAVGGLLGFLFGVPRTVDPVTGAAAVAAKQAAQAAQAVAAGQGSPAASAPQAPLPSPQAALAANTNLERISDWLTTLLIGATLAQSRTLLEWLHDSGTTLGLAQPANEKLVPIVIVYFLVLGFLGVYLITRLYLTLALQQTLKFVTGSSPAAVTPATTTPNGGNAPGLTLAAPALPDGQVGQPYPATSLQATGGTPPLTWSVSPALPGGLALNPAPGNPAGATVDGTPSAAAAATTYTVTVTDSATPAQTASAAATFAVQ